MVDDGGTSMNSVLLTKRRCTRWSDLDNTGTGQTWQWELGGIEEHRRLAPSWPPALKNCDVDREEEDHRRWPNRGWPRVGLFLDWQKEATLIEPSPDLIPRWFSSRARNQPTIPFGPFDFVKKNSELLGWTKPSLASQKPATVQENRPNSVCLFCGPNSTRAEPKTRPVRPALLTSISDFGDLFSTIAC
jgi:hypothetical protein